MTVDASLTDKAPAHGNESPLTSWCRCPACGRRGAGCSRHMAQTPSYVYSEHSAVAAMDL